MARAIWKGAVSFGLVYIPVELHSASRNGALDLDLLDSRDFAPVGYQRYNKKTGEVVDWGDVVKGFQYKKGQYVALSDADFRRANVKATQTIEIDSFTEAGEIPPVYYETPYFLVPIKGGEKGYALLRESLRRSGKVAVGNLVMRGRQHVGVIQAAEGALFFITLRFADELRPSSELELPAVGTRSTRLAPREIAMAERLVEEMTESWNPNAFRDTYRADLMKRIREKIRKKQTHQLTPDDAESPEPPRSAEIIDLMAVLKKSLESRGKSTAAKTRKHPAANKRRSG